ncbi:MAG: phage tail protein, partial [Exiguobacterium sp.]|nr:phage tail protein [Exiguobacterium sp.]
MIPILYDYAERRFTTNGYGRLSDCISCKVTEERNGIYECEFEYPMTGAHYSEIKEGLVIGVTHDETGDIQPFDIYAHDAPIDGVVTFYAHHVSYRLSNVVIMPFTATTVVSALDGLTSYAANPHDFEFWTDKTSSGSFELTKPDYARAILGGQQGSILDAFGKGDYEFDRFTVKLWANRGQDSGVTIRYGKNLVNIKEKTEADGTYNAVVPFWLGSEGALVTLPEKVLIYSGATIYEANLTNENQVIIRDHLGNPITVTYQQINAIPLDMSSDFQE